MFSYNYNHNNELYWSLYWTYICMYATLPMVIVEWLFSVYAITRCWCLLKYLFGWEWYKLGAKCGHILYPNPCRLLELTRPVGTGRGGPWNDIVCLHMNSRSSESIPFFSRFRLRTRMRIKSNTVQCPPRLQQKYINKITGKRKNER